MRRTLEQAVYAAGVYGRLVYHPVKRALGLHGIRPETARTRWGRIPDGVLRAIRGRRVVWLNALSGGEATQLVTFTRELRRKLPDHALVLSTNNDYAADFARANLPWLDAVFETPWDLAWVCDRALDAVRPDVLVFVENVYSPVLAARARRRGVATVLASGMVRRAFAGHPIYRRMFALRFERHIERFLVKAPADREELVGPLGVDPARVAVAGNMKFDLDFLSVPPEALREARSSLGLDVDPGFVVLAGSTHEGEATLVVEAVARARAEGVDARLVIAPRYAATRPEVERAAADRGLSVIRRSDFAPDGKSRPDVVLVDTFGELPRLYPLADACVLGGTFFRRWGVGFGQNLVEPLAAMRPVLFGPHVSQFRDITQTLLSAWPEQEARDAGELAAALLALARDRTLYERVVDSQRRVLETDRGAPARHAVEVSRIALERVP